MTATIVTVMACLLALAMWVKSNAEEDRANRESARADLAREERDAAIRRAKKAEYDHLEALCLYNPGPLIEALRWHELGETDAALREMGRG